jgi:hypothetical protein
MVLINHTSPVSLNQEVVEQTGAEAVSIRFSAEVLVEVGVVLNAGVEI